MIRAVSWQNGKVKILNQTLLPEHVRYNLYRHESEVRRAIKRLEVRGAPAIGIAGACGVALGVGRKKFKSFKSLWSQTCKVCRYLETARPTAVNLAWAMQRMEGAAWRARSKTIPEIKKQLYRESLKIANEDKNMCDLMAEWGVRLFPKSGSVLTHCNTGALATGGCGTALGVIYKAKKLGRKVKVYVDETRPLLQGARLTTWELTRAGINTTLICDNMAAVVMKQKLVNAVFIGADRIAANGDTANKIGSYGLACLAVKHKIPFYVVAPSSTFDLSIKSGHNIPIEERGGDEIKNVHGKATAPKNVKTYNPAFDVTPGNLISAIVTEKGIIRKPFKQNILKKLGSRKNVKWRH